MTKKVWVQVEVEEGRPGEERPRLIGGLDPEKARDAFRELLAFKPGYGPDELFNKQNPMYRAPRSLWDVISEDYKRDPGERALAMRNARYAVVEKVTDERVAEWQRDHPKEEAAIVESKGVQPGREAYIALRKARADSSVMQFMARQSLSPEDVVATAEWLGVTPQELSHATMGDDDAPFVSEAYLYALLGKDLARSITARLGTLQEALGLGRIYERTLEACPTCGHVGH